MSYLVVRIGRTKTGALEPRGDHRDVVRTAILVRMIDQTLARSEEIRLLGDHAGDVVLRYLARESIAAEHQRVAAPYGLMREVRLDRRLRTECLENDVATLALRRFFLRELPSLDELLHQRLILRDLPRDAAAHEIR